MAETEPVVLAEPVAVPEPVIPVEAREVESPGESELVTGNPSPQPSPTRGEEADAYTGTISAPPPVVVVTEPVVVETPLPPPVAVEPEPAIPAVAVAEPIIPIEAAVKPVVVEGAQPAAETELTGEPETDPEISQASEEPATTIAVAQ